jgi:L-rhamnose mutarotase
MTVQGLEYNIPLTHVTDRVNTTLRKGAHKIKRVGFLLKVREELLEEYKTHHENVWPDMLKALTRSGWRNYSIFAREDGLLFGYFEAQNDFESSLKAMSSEEANARWQEFMAPYFEIPQGARPDQMMVDLEEIFHLD